MKTFKDCEGANWDICLNLGTVKKIKDKLGINLLEIEQGEPPLLTRLGTDELFLAEIILCCIETQIEKRKLSEQDVLSRFDGQTIGKAQSCFYEELIDFFQQKNQPHKMKMVQKQLALIELAIKAAISKIDEINIEEISGQMYSS